MFDKAVFGLAACHTMIEIEIGAGTSLDVSSDILRTLQRALLSGALQACSTPLLVAKQRNSKYCLTK